MQIQQASQIQQTLMLQNTAQIKTPDKGAQETPQMQAPKQDSVQISSAARQAAAMTTNDRDTDNMKQAAISRTNDNDADDTKGPKNIQLTV